jgi:hypothetical protein
VATARRIGARSCPHVRPAPRPVAKDGALVRVLEASIEILKTGNAILRCRLAAAETWAAQAVITKRLDTLAANRLDAPATAESDPRRSLLRYWFGWRAA